MTDQSFLEDLRSSFLAESKDASTDFEELIIQLEDEPDNKSLKEAIFRMAHNLKGASSAVGLVKLTEFVHVLEDLLVKLRDGIVEVDKDLINILLQSNDALNQSVEALHEDFNNEIEQKDVLKSIKSFTGGKEKTTVVSQQAPKSAIDKGFALFDEPDEESEEDHPPGAFAQEISEEELRAHKEEVAKEVMSKLSTPGEAAVTKVNGPSGSQQKDAKPPLNSVQKQGAAPGDAKNKRAADIRISLQKVDQLLNFSGQQVVLQGALNHVREMLPPEFENMNRTIEQLNVITRNLQNSIMSLRMVPVRTLFNKMKRVCRDTAHVVHKEVRLEIVGEDNELDYSVIESIESPLTHIIRNAVDHGVEIPDERRLAGKNATGVVLLKARQQGGILLIEVQDDGAGMDPARIQSKAEEKGIIPPGLDLNESQIFDLIFHNGFSTKEKVTAISGRGVGMDVVRFNLKRLSGSIEISSKKGKGTSFTIYVPTVVGIIDALIIRVADRRYSISIDQVHEILNPDAVQLSQLSEGDLAVSIRERTLPLFYLDWLLGLREAEEIPALKRFRQGSKASLESNKVILVMSDNQNREFAVQVDDIVSRSRLVSKSLSREISQLPGHNGITILGDGTPVPILDVAKLITHLTREIPSAA